MTDLQVSISERGLQETLAALIEVFEFEYSHNTQGNPWFSVFVKCHLSNGALAVIPPNPANPIYTGGFLSFTNIEVIWDNLDLGATVHVPGVTVGGGCVVSVAGKCIVSLPSITIFDCDVGGTVPIDNVVRSKISLGMAPVARHALGEWDVVPHFVWSNIEPINVVATVTDAIQSLVDDMINALLAPLPGWVKDIIDDIVGGMFNFVRALLDLPNDLQNWLSDLLRVSLDVWDLLLQLVGNIFSDKIVLAKFDDPLTILKAEKGPPALPAVTIPVKQLDISCRPGELVMEVSI